MNVVGVGVDLVHVPGFAEQLALPGTRFAAVFTPNERADIAERGGHPRHAAVRWAAKEALVKAWSASLHGQPPVMGDTALSQIETVTDAWSRPRLRLLGEVGRRLEGYDAQVSLSHDGEHAIAYVVLSRECDASDAETGFVPATSAAMAALASGVISAEIR